MSTKTAVYDPGHSLKGEGSGTKKCWLPWGECACTRTSVLTPARLTASVPNVRRMITTKSNCSHHRGRTAARLSLQLRHNSLHATDIIFNREMSLMYLRMVTGTPESKLCLSTKIKSLLSPSLFLSPLLSFPSIIPRLLKTTFFGQKKSIFTSVAF